MLTTSTKWKVVLFKGTVSQNFPLVLFNQKISSGLPDLWFKVDSNTTPIRRAIRFWRQSRAVPSPGIWSLGVPPPPQRGLTQGGRKGGCTSRVWHWEFTNSYGNTHPYIFLLFHWTTLTRKLSHAIPMVQFFQKGISTDMIWRELRLSRISWFTAKHRWC